MIQYIEKEVVSPKGALLRYHFVAGVRAVRSALRQPTFIATIQSFGTLDGLRDGNALDTQSMEVGAMHATAFDEDVFGQVHDIMLSREGSLYAGGTLQVLDIGTATLEAAREARWEQVKAWRSVAISTNMTTPWGPIQCATEDRQNITDGILLAQTLTGQNLPVEVQWTMADNTVVTLDLQALTTIGLLLGQKVQAAHATARTLRAQIDAATTVEEVQAVQWPQ